MTLPSKFTPLVNSTREWVQFGGGGQTQSTDIKQIADALFPADESAAISLLTKADIDPDIEADIAWIYSRGAFNGKLPMAGLVNEGATVPLYFSTFKVANSYGIKGKAREQLTRVLAASGAGARRGFRRFMGRGSSYEGGGVSGGGFTE